MPKFAVGENAAAIVSDDCNVKHFPLNETINTEAFISPKSDIITSSPIAERDANIISVKQFYDFNDISNYKF